MKSILCTFFLLFAFSGAANDRKLHLESVVSVGNLQVPGEDLYAFGGKPLTIVNDVAYFLSNYFIWESDGTTSGTRPISGKKFFCGIYSNGTEVLVCYYGSWTDHSTYLAKLNLTTKKLEGEIEVFNTTNYPGVMQNESFIKDKFYFVVNNTTYVTNLTSGETSILLAPTASSSYKTSLFTARNFLVSKTESETGDIDIRSISSSDEILLLRSIKRPDMKDVYVFEPLAVRQNFMLFSISWADRTTLNGRYQLWHTDGSVNGTYILKEGEGGVGADEVNGQNAYSDDVNFVHCEVGARQGNIEKPCKLFTTDGTVARTGQKDDFIVGSGRFFLENGKFFFWGYDEKHKFEIWETGLLPSSTKMVRNLRVGGKKPGGLDYLGNINGNTIIGRRRGAPNAEDTNPPNELLNIDGSGAVSVIANVREEPLTDLSEATLDRDAFMASFIFLGRLRSKIFFSASTKGIGRTLWVTDGSPSGTFPLTTRYNWVEGYPPEILYSSAASRALLVSGDLLDVVQPLSLGETKLFKFNEVGSSAVTLPDFDSSLKQVNYSMVAADRIYLSGKYTPPLGTYSFEPTTFQFEKISDQQIPLHEHAEEIGLRRYSVVGKKIYKFHAPLNAESGYQLKAFNLENFSLTPSILSQGGLFTAGKFAVSENFILTVGSLDSSFSRRAWLHDLRNNTTRELSVNHTHWQPADVVNLPNDRFLVVGGSGMELLNATSGTFAQLESDYYYRGVDTLQHVPGRLTVADKVCFTLSNSLTRCSDGTVSGTDVIWSNGGGGGADYSAPKFSNLVSDGTRIYFLSSVPNDDFSSRQIILLAYDVKAGYLSELHRFSSSVYLSHTRPLLYCNGQLIIHPHTNELHYYDLDTGMAGEIKSSQIGAVITQMTNVDCNPDGFYFGATIRLGGTGLWRWGKENSRSNDLDNDGVENSLDKFPHDPRDHLDSDSDGLGNSVDEDDDNDGIYDTFDNTPTEYQIKVINVTEPEVSTPASPEQAGSGSGGGAFSVSTLFLLLPLVLLMYPKSNKFRNR